MDVVVALLLVLFRNKPKLLNKNTEPNHVGSVFNSLLYMQHYGSRVWWEGSPLVLWNGGKNCIGAFMAEEDLNLYGPGGLENIFGGKYIEQSGCSVHFLKEIHDSWRQAHRAFGGQKPE